MTEFSMTRRDFLRLGLAGGAGLLVSDLRGFSLLDMIGIRSSAKAVIQIWLAGGPPHTDMFDPKPESGPDYCGPYNKPIATNVDGIQIGQMLPMLAKNADKYSLLRGMTHGNNGHETAAYMVLTGRKPVNGLVFPGMGAVVSYFKGGDDKIPPYITVTTPMGRFSETGFLGTRYKSFATGGDPNGKIFAVEGVVSENIKEDRQRSRKKLLGDLDVMGGEMADEPLMESMDACRERAYSVILGDEGKVFSLDGEKAGLRDKYGRSKFGQSCLLARRLVENGSKYVVINSPGWDTHKQHFEEMNKKLPELDKGVATLLEDLSDRGMLDETIVWVCGEFGRTPKIATEAPWNGGRHHYGKAFSALVAGGGFKGGRIVGKTDDKGENVVERPVYPWDLTCSIYQRMGIDLNAKLKHPMGRDVFVSPFVTNEIPEKETGGLLKEIM